MNYWDIAKIFLILFVMLGVMYLLLYLVKKYLYTVDTKKSNSYKINILSTQTLLPKKFVSVIKIKNKVYILGVADNSVNLIDKMDDLSDENTYTSINSEEKLTFLQLLKKNMGLG